MNAVKGTLVAFKSSNNLLRSGPATALFSTSTPIAPIAPAHALIAQDTSPFVFALANATGGRKCALFRAILQRPYDNSVHDKMPEWQTYQRQHIDAGQICWGTLDNQLLTLRHFSPRAFLTDMVLASISLLEMKFSACSTLFVASFRSSSNSFVVPANGSTTAVGHACTPSG